MIAPETIEAIHHRDATGAVVFGTDEETGRRRWGRTARMARTKNFKPR